MESANLHETPVDIGANDPNRTDDLLITSELLYQLSYVGFYRVGTC